MLFQKLLADEDDAGNAAKLAELPVRRTTRDGQAVSPMVGSSASVTHAQEPLKSPSWSIHESILAAGEGVKGRHGGGILYLNIGPHEVTAHSRRSATGHLFLNLTRRKGNGRSLAYGDRRAKRGVSEVGLEFQD